ncbi:hypothetical protein EOM09_09285 [bacterium]|nr:hypothetical protein [bacterium]
MYFTIYKLPFVLLNATYNLFLVELSIILKFTSSIFSKLLVIGFITIITTQSFMNIAAITGIMPLTGVPLVFISHGGTALFLSMGMMGIVLNISGYQGKPKLAKRA